MELAEVPAEDGGLCIVCEQCNVGKVKGKQPLGDRVTNHSKTPLTKLLSSLLKEVVTQDMMLCIQCLKCLNKKDKLMVLEKRGLGGNSKPRPSRPKGKKAPGGGQTETSQRRGKGQKRKALSGLNCPLPDSKQPKLGEPSESKTDPGRLGSSTTTDVPCITAIKDEVLSDEESQQQTTEICFNSDTVVATTTTPQCPHDPLALDAEEPFHCDLIKSEITVDGDDCVVGVRCGDGTSGPPAALHVVSSIGGPAPGAECMLPAADLPTESAGNTRDLSETCFLVPPAPCSPHTHISSAVSASNASISSYSDSSIISFTNSSFASFSNSPILSVPKSKSSVSSSSKSSVSSSSKSSVSSSSKSSVLSYPESSVLSYPESSISSILNPSIISIPELRVGSAGTDDSVSIVTPVANFSPTSGSFSDFNSNGYGAVATKAPSNTFTICSSANFNVTVNAASITDAPLGTSSVGELAPLSAVSPVERNSSLSNSVSLGNADPSFSASYVVRDSNLLSPVGSKDTNLGKWSNAVTFQIGENAPQVLNSNTESKTSSPEDETTYIDMPNILAFPDGRTESIEEATCLDAAELAHSLIAEDDKRLPQADVGCFARSVFPCSLCSRSFETAGALRLHHEQGHNKLKRAQCLSCPFYSSEFAEVEDHMRNEHQTQSQHYCKFCEATFILKDSHQNHMKVVHKTSKSRTNEKAAFSSVLYKDMITCPHCGAPFGTNKELIVHNERVHNGQAYSCKYCSFKTSSYKTLARHDADKHKVNSEFIFVCRECEKEFKNEAALEKHCADDHDLQKIYSCKKCGDVFITEVMMRFHEASHNSYCCQICNCGFKKREFYEAHMKKVHNNDHAGLNLEVPDVTRSLLSHQSSDSPDIYESQTQEVLSTTKNLQLLLETVQNQSAISGQELLPGSDEGVRQYDKETADDYLKKVRGIPYNQKVPCIFCQKKVTAGHLRTHFKNHSGVTPFSCSYCSKVCIQSTNLRKHVRSMHPEHYPTWDIAKSKTPKKISIACEFCGVLFDSVDECELHLWEHVSSKDHECSRCKTKFGSEQNLKEHMKTHYFDSLEKCKHCRIRTFKNIGAYNEHVENCKNQWTCPTCGMCLRSENRFRKHMKAMHSSTDPYKYVCPEPGCDRKFFEKHRYDDHCITHESKRRYQCPHCSKKFKRIRPMKEHIRNKHNDVRCSGCEMPFTSVDELVQHRIKLHSSDFRECPECALMFVNDATLANHVRCCHPDDEAFEIPQCHICNELWASEAELSTHFTEHQKGNYICCAFGCYASFPCDEDYRDHLSIGHEDLDFECVYCQADQLSEAALRRHFVDAHGKERQCPVCATPCYRDEHLQRHASQHGGDSKYLCDACDFTCNNRYWMVAHLNGTHRVSSEDLTGCIMQQRVYECSSCSIFTVTLEDMTQHILLHETDNSRVTVLHVPTKLTAHQISCPVCDTPWPNQRTITEHLETSIPCSERLSQLNYRFQNDNDAGSGQVEGQIENVSHAAEPTLITGDIEETLIADDAESMLIPKVEGVESSTESEERLELIGNALTAAAGEGNAGNVTVVEHDGAHYLIFNDSGDHNIEAAAQVERSLVLEHLTTNKAEQLDDHEPSEIATGSIELNEEDFASLLNKPEQLVYPRGLLSS